MSRIVILENDGNVPPGYLGEACRTAGAEVTVVPLHAGQSVPAGLDWDGVVSLGGHMGAYDEAEFPYLSDEKRFLRRAAEAGVPTLGLCLGSQLLADALGGTAYLGDAPEISYTPVELTVAGEADPVASQLHGPVLVFHQDTWAVPPGATLLARTDRYPQAFRWGSAVAVQPHPETTPEILDEWVTHAAARELAARIGVDLGELAGEVRSAAEEGQAIAGRFFGAWLKEVAAHQPADAL